MLDFKNVRIEVAHRKGAKDWADTGRYLSIRAYRGRPQHGDAVFMGPDVPIETSLPDDIVEHLARLGFIGGCGDDTHWAEVYETPAEK